MSDSRIRIVFVGDKNSGAEELAASYQKRKMSKLDLREVSFDYDNTDTPIARNVIIVYNPTDAASFIHATLLIGKVLESKRSNVMLLSLGLQPALQPEAVIKELVDCTKISFHTETYGSLTHIETFLAKSPVAAYSLAVTTEFADICAKLKEAQEQALALALSQEPPSAEEAARAAYAAEDEARRIAAELSAQARDRAEVARLEAERIAAEEAERVRVATAVAKERAAEAAREARIAEAKRQGAALVALAMRDDFDKSIRALCHQDFIEELRAALSVAEKMQERLAELGGSTPLKVLIDADVAKFTAYLNFAQMNALYGGEQASVAASEQALFGRARSTDQRPLSQLLDLPEAAPAAAPTATTQGAEDVDFAARMAALLRKA